LPNKKKSMQIKIKVPRKAIRKNGGHGSGRERENPNANFNTKPHNYYYNNNNNDGSSRNSFTVAVVSLSSPPPRLPPISGNFAAVEPPGDGDADSHSRRA